MRKINFAKHGIGVSFIPLVDRHFNLVAYEAVKPTEVTHPQLATLFCYPQYDQGEVGYQLNEFYKAVALKTYNHSVPLILSSGDWYDPFPDALPESRNFEVIITLEMIFGFELRLEAAREFASNGIHYAFTNFGHGTLSIQYIVSIQPKYYKLARSLTDQSSSEQEAALKALEKVILPFRERGIQFIATGIERQEQWEQMLPIADVFEGTWITSQFQARA